MLRGEINPKKNQKGAPRMDKENEREGREWGQLCSPWLTENGGGRGELRRAETAASWHEMKRGKRGTTEEGLGYI